MSGIKGIIETHRARLEASGLMRQVTAAPLPPHINQIVSPHAKALAVLRECPDRLRVQSSPMAMFFEQTLPKLELVLVELGEVRAEQIVSRLCEHGKAMMEQHGVEGSRKHLEELFADLPNYEAELIKEEEVLEVTREENGAEAELCILSGIDHVIFSYQEISYGGRGMGYLGLKLKDKIEEIKANEEGRISLHMRPETNDRDLRMIGKAKDIRELDLSNAQVSDLTPLNGLVSLIGLKLTATQVSDVGPLVGLPQLRMLYLSKNDLGYDHLDELKATHPELKVFLI